MGIYGELFRIWSSLNQLRCPSIPFDHPSEARVLLLSWSCLKFLNLF